MSPGCTRNNPGRGKQRRRKLLGTEAVDGFILRQQKQTFTTSWVCVSSSEQLPHRWAVRICHNLSPAFMDSGEGYRGVQRGAWQAKGNRTHLRGLAKKDSLPLYHLAISLTELTYRWRDQKPLSTPCLMFKKHHKPPLGIYLSSNQSSPSWAFFSLWACTVHLGRDLLVRNTVNAVPGEGGLQSQKAWHHPGCRDSEDSNDALGSPAMTPKPMSGCNSSSNEHHGCGSQAIIVILSSYRE